MGMLRSGIFDKWFSTVKNEEVDKWFSMVKNQEGAITYHISSKPAGVLCPAIRPSRVFCERAYPQQARLGPPVMGEHKCRLGYLLVIQGAYAANVNKLKLATDEEVGDSIMIEVNGCNIVFGASMLYKVSQSLIELGSNGAKKQLQSLAFHRVKSDRAVWTRSQLQEQHAQIVQCNSLTSTSRRWKERRSLHRPGK